MRTGVRVGWPIGRKATTMKLKLDDAGHVVLADGKPVYVHDDGKEVPFDAAATVATISRLNGEARDHRVRAEQAEGRLKLFEGIDDAEAARKALATVKNLDDKKLVDAGEVERVKTEAIKAVEDRFKPIVTERDRLAQQLTDEMIGGAFARSRFIADKLAIPADLVQARFGGAFKIEGGKVTAYDAAGNKMFSRVSPGEAPGFDEALEMLVDSYPHRDTILKGSGASGGGAQGGGGNAGGGKVMPRAAFDALPAAAKHAHVKAGGTVTD